MTKFTKEEINLCKQVAERHGKEIEYGDWYSDPMRKEGYQVRLCEYQGKQNFGKIYFGFIPLWTISDCLEFLEEKGFGQDVQFTCFSDGNWRLTAEDGRYRKVRGECKTRLEACLDVVLAVLEEKK